MRFTAISAELKLEMIQIFFPSSSTPFHPPLLLPARMHVCATSNNTRLERRPQMQTIGLLTIIEQQRFS
jgi:hypothetical protein